MAAASLLLLMLLEAVKAVSVVDLALLLVAKHLVGCLRAAYPLISAGSGSWHLVLATRQDDTASRAFGRHS